MQLGNVTGAQLDLQQMERIETIRSDGKIDGADPTIAALTGNIGALADTALDRRGRQYAARTGLRLHHRCWINL